jgi:O-acetylhomoserine (thiol)-lyase
MDPFSDTPYRTVESNTNQSSCACSLQHREKAHNVQTYLEREVYLRSPDEEHPLIQTKSTSTINRRHKNNNINSNTTTTTTTMSEEKCDESGANKGNTDRESEATVVRGLESLCLHAGYCHSDATTSRAVPLYRTAPYQFRSTQHAANLFALKELGFIYTRIGNPYVSLLATPCKRGPGQACVALIFLIHPSDSCVFLSCFLSLFLTPCRTQEILEHRFAAMEGGAAALCVSSGTAACFYSIINLAEQGDNIVSARNLYGGTFAQFNDILPKFGITATFVDITDPAAVRGAINDKTRAIFCETVSNPALEISPLEELGVVAREAGIPLVADDTFTTPYLCKPFELGASVVVHSLTKWSGGHGTSTGGIILDSGTFDWQGGKHPLYTQPDSSYGGIRWGMDLPEELAPIAFILRARTVPLRNLGACISPDNCWMFPQGIETLPLRMERHCENALKVAQFLKNRMVPLSGSPT